MVNIYNKFNMWSSGQGCQPFLALFTGIFYILIYTIYLFIFDQVDQVDQVLKLLKILIFLGLTEG